MKSATFCLNPAFLNERRRSAKASAAFPDCSASAAAIPGRTSTPAGGGMGFFARFQNSIPICAANFTAPSGRSHIHVRTASIVPFSRTRRFSSSSSGTPRVRRNSSYGVWLECMEIVLSSPPPTNERSSTAASNAPSVKSHFASPASATVSRTKSLNTSINPLSVAWRLPGSDAASRSASIASAPNLRTKRTARLCAATRATSAGLSRYSGKRWRIMRWLLRTYIATPRTVSESVRARDDARAQTPRR